MEFFLRIVPDGELTPQLYKLQQGDQLLMRKVAKGRFTTRHQERSNQPSPRLHGDGHCAFVSYVRTLYQDWKDAKFAGEHKLFLLTGASRSWSSAIR